MVNYLREQALEKHESGGQRSAKLVRQRDPTQIRLLILFLLRKKLTVELHRFNLTREVIEVDCDGVPLCKVNALHPNLVVFLDWLSRVTLKLVDVVFLVWFIFLDRDYILETLDCLKFKLDFILIARLSIS